MSSRSPEPAPTRPSSRSQGDEGFTLIELTIALAIFSVLALLIMYTLTGFMSIQDSTLNRFYATSQAQNIIDQFARDLRTAVTPPNVSGITSPFVSVTPTSITFYADLGGSSPTEIHAYIAATNAGATNCPCDFHEDTYTNGAWQTRIDGTYVASSSSISTTTVFTYYSAPTAQASSPTPITIASTGATAPTDNATLDQIALIGVNLLTQIKPTSPITTVNTLVELRNVAFDPNQGAG